MRTRNIVAVPITLYDKGFNCEMVHPTLSRARKEQKANVRWNKSTGLKRMEFIRMTIAK